MVLLLLVLAFLAVLLLLLLNHLEPRNHATVVAESFDAEVIDASLFTVSRVHQDHSIRVSPWFTRKIAQSVSPRLRCDRSFAQTGRPNQTGVTPGR